MNPFNALMTTKDISLAFKQFYQSNYLSIQIAAENTYGTGVEIDLALVFKAIKAC